MNTSTSESLFENAKTHLVGGVNSPVRAFNGVGGTPLFFTKGEGAYIFDADGNRYIDYVGSWGPMILGHRHPDVVSALEDQLAEGTGFGAPHPLEANLADKVHELLPLCEKIRFVNSGTEATMSAIRLARGVTGRDQFIKFEGCYHGHGDPFLVAAGSGAATLGVPSSPGVPKGTTADTLLLPYNNLEAVAARFEEHKDTIAAVIVEPVAGNMGCIPPVPGFLEGLRELCSKHGALLIFDEVMTGFRVSSGGAVKRFGVTPDLVTLGKVIGGGLPVGAYGGCADLMAQLAPEGPVYQAGTLSGNPLAMAAGLSTLTALQAPGFYEDLEAKGETLASGLAQAFLDAGFDYTHHRVGAMGSTHFSAGPVENFAQAMAADTETYGKFFHGMLNQGVYLAPSAFEAWFVSAALSDEDVAQTVAAAQTVLADLK